MISADIFLTHRDRVLIHNGDWVVGVLFVPLGDEFIAGLADEFAVEDRAAESAGDVQAVVHGRVGAEGDGEVIIQIDGGVKVPRPSTLTSRPARQYSTT
jgi:hypothetical protein